MSYAPVYHVGVRQQKTFKPRACGEGFQRRVVEKVMRILVSHTYSDPGYAGPAVGRTYFSTQGTNTYTHFQLTVNFVSGDYMQPARIKLHAKEHTNNPVQKPNK